MRENSNDVIIILQIIKEKEKDTNTEQTGSAMKGNRRKNYYTNIIVFVCIVYKIFIFVCYI